MYAIFSPKTISFQRKLTSSQHTRQGSKQSGCLTQSLGSLQRVVQSEGETGWNLFPSLFFSAQSPCPGIPLKEILKVDFNVLYITIYKIIRRKKNHTFPISHFIFPYTWFPWLPGFWDSTQKGVLSGFAFCPPPPPHPMGLYRLTAAIPAYSRDEGMEEEERPEKTKHEAELCPVEGNVL